MVRARTELEDLRSSSQQEIQELQSKLHSAGLTLASVRQQAANDLTATNTMMHQSNDYNMPFAPPKNATVGYVSLPPMPPQMPPQMPQQMPSMHPYYTANTSECHNTFSLKSVRYE